MSTFKLHSAELSPVMEYLNSILCSDLRKWVHVAICFVKHSMFCTSWCDSSGVIFLSACLHLAYFCLQPRQKVNIKLGFNVTAENCMFHIYTLLKGISCCPLLHVGESHVTIKVARSGSLRKSESVSRPSVRPPACPVSAPTLPSLHLTIQ